MRFNKTSGNNINELDNIRSQSRLLIAQNRCKRQNRQLSMLQRAASEVGLTTESLNA